MTVSREFIDIEIHRCRMIDALNTPEQTKIDHLRIEHARGMVAAFTELLLRRDAEAATPAEKVCNRD